MGRGCDSPSSGNGAGFGPPEEFHMHRLVGFLALATAAMACGSGGSGSGGGNTQPTVTLMAGFDPGPAPDASKGFQIVAPYVTDIEPGTSQEFCYYTPMILTDDAWVSSNQGIQS